MLVPWAVPFCIISRKMGWEWRFSKVLSDKGEIQQEKPLGRSVPVVYEGRARVSEAGPEGTEERGREELCLQAPW